ncbi:winged helix-turn-helix transcriptional regulator [Streptomyces sp. NPDC005970]|uniref:winged helix-turn-helix transcriptional regulator n=1 Tax=Streptomyces sp. NPDC005970 TaxID=3156723 RepID=UPI0033E6864E
MVTKQLLKGLPEDAEPAHAGAHGLVERTLHPTVPPQVEYTLTEPGRALRTTVVALHDRTHQYVVG